MRLPTTFAILLLAVGASSTDVRAETDPYPDRVPLGEMGLVAVVSTRPTHPASMGGDADGATNLGLGLRADISVIGWLLPIVLDTGPLRIGDYVGLDLGTDIGFGLSGHWIIGGQIAYEVTKDVGVGVRAYSLTIFDSLLDGWENFLVGELSGRVGRITGRGRASVKQAGNSGANDYGASIRFPTPWKILGYDGWAAGVDYDYLTYRESSGDAVMHRLTAVVALGI